LKRVKLKEITGPDEPSKVFDIQGESMESTTIVHGMWLFNLPEKRNLFKGM
jgi:hypothetical protein